MFAVEASVRRLATATPAPHSDADRARARWPIGLRSCPDPQRREWPEPRHGERFDRLPLDPGRASQRGDVPSHVPTTVGLTESRPQCVVSLVSLTAPQVRRQLVRDLDEGLLRIRATRLRPVHEHGCDGACGTKPGYCPQRRVLTEVTGDTKSDAGRRVVGLPPELVEMLVAHRSEQERERVAARDLWQPGEWVFTSETGEPLNPNSDYHRWKALLPSAGVRDGRLHDARHTAATVLLALGVPEQTVMGIMGWSSTSMAAPYQHVTDPIRRAVARQVGGLLWKPSEEGT